MVDDGGASGQQCLQRDEIDQADIAGDGRGRVELVGAERGDDLDVEVGDSGTCSQARAWAVMSSSLPTGIAVRPASLIAWRRSGWLATHTSCPAARSAHATGTIRLRCGLAANVVKSTHIRPSTKRSHGEYIR